MSAKTDRLKIIYSGLTSSEKEEFKTWVNRYDESSSDRQRMLSEGLKSNLGPTDGSRCPYCGKA